MKRFHLSTLLLVVVIAALGLAVLEQGLRARRRESELRAEIARLVSDHRAEIARLKQADVAREWETANYHRMRHAGSILPPNDPNVGNTFGR